MTSAYLLRPVRTLQQALAARSEPSLRAILEGSFERVYQPDGSFRLREVGSGLYLEELDALGRPIPPAVATGSAPATANPAPPEQADVRQPTARTKNDPPRGPDRRLCRRP